MAGSDSDGEGRGGGGEEEEQIIPTSYGRSVGAKVTRAALLGEKVKKGCGVCAKRKREEIMV